jgi:protein-tyrosine phosphatase
VTKQPGWIDVHAHLVPGVDDGARDMEESLSILREAARIEVREIVCTPHVFFGDGEKAWIRAADRFATLRQAAAAEGLPVVLHLGAELMLDPDLPARVRENSGLTFGGKGKFVLVEVPPNEIPGYAATVFFELCSRGITPVWAHPERCAEVIRDDGVLDRYAASGVLFQINAGSLLGKYGFRVKRAATRMVKNGLGHLCASDAHRSRHLSERLLPAFDRVVKIAGGACAEAMFSGRPSQLLA